MLVAMDTPLRAARIAAGKKLADLVAVTGLTDASLSRIERGLQGVTPETAEKLSRYLGNVSEMEILYPERYVDRAQQKGRSGAAA